MYLIVILIFLYSQVINIIFILILQQKAWIDYMYWEGTATQDVENNSRALPIPVVDGTIWPLLSWLPRNGHRLREAKHFDTPPEEGSIQLFNYTDSYFIHLMYLFARILISGSAFRELALRYQAKSPQKR